MVKNNKMSVPDSRSNRRGRKRTKARTIVGTKQRNGESDGVYIFKLVVVTLVSTLWLKFAIPMSIGNFVLTAIPLGLIISLLCISAFEKDSFERRIWYAVALVIGIITYFVPAGIIV